jgi:hypothetical protein
VRAFAQVKKKPTKTTTKNINYEIGILVYAKKMRLSFDELSMLTLDEFYQYSDIYFGDEETERIATQDDIDTFFMM